MRYNSKYTIHNRIRAFFLGMAEFRTDLTTSFESQELMETYDLGREWAHKLTFRRFDS